MNSWESIQVLSQLAITSEYFLQVTLDTSGRVLSSDSGIGPVPSLFDYKEKPIFFADCFLSSEWSKYEKQRIKAWKSSHQSFFIELHKINYPDKSTTLTRWEFFFISEDFGTCLGIGHPVDPLKPYSLGLGEFIDGNFGNNELVDSLLENKLLGFWKIDPQNEKEQISHGLAQMLGYQGEDAQSYTKLTWQQHIHPDDLTRVGNQLRVYLKTKGNLPFRSEFRMMSKNHQITWVIAFGKTTHWTSDGYPQLLQGLLIDISEKKKQEIWLREHHYFLKDLAFQQSHSLRARVANIMGILEIIETESHSEETQKLLNMIKTETKMLDNSLKKSIKESVQQNQSWERGIKKED